MQVFEKSFVNKLPDSAQGFVERVEQKDAVIGVVGLGYVGLPIALEFAKTGFRCIGVDLSDKKIDSLKRGENYIEDLIDAEVREVIETGMLIPTQSYVDLAAADVIFICVPTPFNDNKDPDLTYILESGKAISDILTPGKLIVLKSTTFPGTTEDHLAPELNRSGLQPGVDYHLAFSPERVDPGNKQFMTANTPIVTGGVDETSTLLAAFVQNQIIDTIYMVSNTRVAEMEKLLENIFRSVNIALVNELAMLCERVGDLNIWEAVEAAGTKPFGYLKFTPGPGVGGHCIPIDPYYLSWMAREYDFETRFITLAANVNESMPYHVTNLVMRQIARQPITLSEARILMVGASFKKNVKDLRHSPTEAVMQRMIEEGITHIDYSDPWVDEYEVLGKTYYSMDMTEESLASYHCVVLITDHDDFDVDFIVRNSSSIVDTRNMTEGVVEGREKVTLLGFTSDKKKALAGLKN